MSNFTYTCLPLIRQLVLLLCVMTTAHRICILHQQITSRLNYLSMEKLVLALITISIKLHHYFDAHPIMALTSSPIKALLR